MSAFKSIVEDAPYWFKEIVISPILYITLIPYLIIWQITFRNVPLELLVIDMILVGVTSMIFIIRFIKRAA